MDEPKEQEERTSLRCRVGMHHYDKKTTDEGVGYLQCSRCGKQDFPGSSFNQVGHGS